MLLPVAHRLDRVGTHRPHQLLLLGQSVAEVAAVAIGARNTIQNHAADLSLVTRVAEDGAELFNAVSKLAVFSIRASSSLLPFVAQLSLEHALIVHL